MGMGRGLRSGIRVWFSGIDVVWVEASLVMVSVEFWIIPPGARDWKGSSVWVCSCVFTPTTVERVNSDARLCALRNITYLGFLCNPSVPIYAEVVWKERGREMSRDNPEKDK